MVAMEMSTDKFVDICHIVFLIIFKFVKMNANSERIEISSDLLEKAEKARSVLLPTKSELKYKKEYDKFLQWMEVNRMDSKNTSETVMLAYFQEMVFIYSFSLICELVYFSYSLNCIVLIRCGLSGQC